MTGQGLPEATRGPQRAGAGTSRGNKLLLRGDHQSKVGLHVFSAVEP